MNHSSSRIITVPILPTGMLNDYIALGKLPFSSTLGRSGVPRAKAVSHSTRRSGRTDQQTAAAICPCATQWSLWFHPSSVPYSCNLSRSASSSDVLGSIFID